MEVDRILAVSKPIKHLQWVTSANKLLDDLMKVTYDDYIVAVPFQDPVDPIRDNAPDYYNVIKYPMCLSKIQSKLVNGEYKTPFEFKDDFKTIIFNCETYNKDENCYIRIMAKELDNQFEKLYVNLISDYEKEKEENENENEQLSPSPSPSPSSQEDQEQQYI